jgi:hypothetical protein
MGPIPQEIVDEQTVDNGNYRQKIFLRATFETYKETITEGIIRIVVKVIIGTGILLAACLFGKIALFSYGIDTSYLLLCVHRYMRYFRRKVWPVRKEDERNYKNYLRSKARLNN